MKLKTTILVFVLFLGWTAKSQEDDFSEFEDPSAPAETPAEAPSATSEATTTATPPAESTSAESAVTESQPTATESTATDPDTLGNENDPLDIVEDEKSKQTEKDEFAEFEEDDKKPKEKAEAPPPAQEPVPEPTPQPETKPIVEAPPPTPPVEEKVTAQPPPVPTVIKTDLFKEEPDFAYEQKLHDIYKKFNEHPTQVEIWEKALGERRSESYRVQKGDTLWDLSQTFFGDAQFWPKIWSLNKKDITNPHSVDSKMTIRFYPGSLQEAPTLGLLTEEKMAEEFKAPNLGELSKEPTTHEVPIKPVGKIPESLPLYRMGAVHRPPVDFEFDSKRAVSDQVSYLQYQFVDAVPETIGRIQETELGTNTAAEFQYVFVKLDSSVVPKKLVVIVEKEKIGNGILLEIQGELEVADKVSDKDTLYRAIVRKSQGLIQVGARLMAGEIPKFNMKSRPLQASQQPVKILGGITGEKITLFGRDSYVFLGAGSEQGLSEGQTLPVYINQQARQSDSQVEYLQGVIGSIKIISLSRNYSTGYVLRSHQMIHAGDWVGTPGLSVPQAASSVVPDSDSSSTTEEEELELE